MGFILERLLMMMMITLYPALYLWAEILYCLMLYQMLYMLYKVCQKVYLHRR